MSTTTNAPPASPASPQPWDKKPEQPATRGRGRAFLIFFVILLIAAGSAFTFGSSRGTSNPRTTPRWKLT